MNPTHNLATILAASALALALAAPSAKAQTSEPTQPDPCHTQAGPVTTKVFYLNLKDDTYHNGAQELERALSTILCRSDKVDLVRNQSAIVVQAPPDRLALAEKLITELDHPRNAYRLTYTITELDSGKTIGTQHYSMVVVAGEHTTMKEGDKIPVGTGSYVTDKATAQTQFTYLDVGMNFDATVNETSNGVQLQSKVEQSSLGQPSTIAGVQEPVVRQTVLQGTSFLTPGKPVMLGSIDIPSSTRHFDIAVVLDQLK